MGTLIDVLIKFGIPIAGLFVIYSGFLFVSARGSEDKVKTAKKTFYSTIIGTAILLGAWVIVTVISATVRALQP
jgi:hypothetical protein